MEGDVLNIIVDVLYQILIISGRNIVFGGFYDGSCKVFGYRCSYTILAIGPPSLGIPLFSRVGNSDSSSFPWWQVFVKLMEKSIA
jgi:hypothetical protein